MDPIQENIKWTVEQAMMLSNDAEQKPEIDQSGYYKASFFFMASAVEALVFLIVKNFHKDNEKSAVYPVKPRYKHLHTLPSELFNDSISGSVGVYAKNTMSFVLKDSIGFQTLNNIMRDAKLCDKDLYSNLERVREQRNRVHIQSLEQKDHQYTTEDVNDAQSVVADLLPLL